MKHLIVLFAFAISIAHSQNIPPVSSGIITIVPNQKINFTNLEFVDGEIVFINTATRSKFRYLPNSVKLIVNANGSEIYRNAELMQKSNLPKAEEKWLILTSESIDKKQVRSEIILKNGDTLKVNVKVKTNLFDGTMINELSLNHKINYYENDVKTILANEVRQLIIVDLKGNFRIFVPNGEDLVERLHDGKIKWLRRFYSNSSGNVSASDFMINETKEGFGISYLMNTKKNLKKVTALKPELVLFIEDMKINDDDILQLLKKYDE